MPTEPHELHERMDAVAAASSDENDLLTVAVAPDDPLAGVRERIEADHAEAEYLDGDASGPLREALEGARRRLTDYDGTPEHGLVLYVGVIEDELVEHVFDDLPGPVPASRYDRANEFDVGPIEAATRPPSTHGLLIVERGGAALGRLEGDRITPLERIGSDVNGKTRAGGQSADRFERRREEQKAEFFETVGEAAARAFLDRDPAAEGTAADGRGSAADAEPTVDGLLLGGTTVTVDEFREAGVLDHRLDDLVVGGTVPVEYASEQGLRQLVDKGRERLGDGDRAMRDALDRFLSGVGGGDDEVVYGREETAEALEYGAVETLLVADAEPGETIGDLGERATEQGGECVVVPGDFERGERFREAFGVGALLRFPLE